jgi:hypothetical protein
MTHRGPTYERGWSVRRIVLWLGIIHRSLGFSGVSFR